MTTPSPFGTDLVVTIWLVHLEEGLRQHADPEAERCSLCMKPLRDGKGDFDEAYGTREFLRLRCRRCAEEGDESGGGA